jgi:hypothetical protein
MSHDACSERLARSVVFRCAYRIQRETSAPPRRTLLCALPPESSRCQLATGSINAAGNPHATLGGAIVGCEQCHREASKFKAMSARVPNWNLMLREVAALFGG